MLTDPDPDTVAGVPNGLYREFTAELLVLPRGQLPEGWTEEKIDQRGASEIAALARDAGYSTNGEAERTGEENAWEFGNRYIGAAELVERGWRPASGAPGALWPGDAGRQRARIVYYRASGVRVDAVAAVPIATTEVAPGRWEGTVPGRVVAPVVLELKHGLASTDVRVVVYDTDGSPVAPRAAVPITADVVEVIALPGARRVAVVPGDPAVEEQRVDAVSPPADGM